MAILPSIFVAIIDDDSIDRRFLRRSFERFDNTIKFIECESCAEARKNLRSASPDLVVIDQQLGDGLGTDLAAEIGGWANLCNSALMILSGSDCVALADFAADSPCQALVSKDELSDKIIVDLIAHAASLHSFRNIPSLPGSELAFSQDVR